MRHSRFLDNLACRLRKLRGAPSPPNPGKENPSSSSSTPSATYRVSSSWRTRTSCVMLGPEPLSASSPAAPALPAAASLLARRCSITESTRGFFASGPVAPSPPGAGAGGGAGAGASADAGAGAGAEADAAGTVVCCGAEPSNKSATSFSSLIASCFTTGLPLTHSCFDRVFRRGS